MSVPLLSLSRFRTAFAISVMVWSLFHVWVIYRFGFSVKVSISDAAATNQFVVLGALLISNSIRFYLPVQNRYIYLLALTAFTTVIALVLSTAILLLIPFMPYRYDNFYINSVPLRFAILFLIFGGIALINVLWYTLQQQQQADQRKAETEQLNKEAELFKLRQQLQPHFLFNSLNSISALVVQQPQKARQMVEQLATFFRGTIRRHDDTMETLEAELEHLKLYLEIEKVRFGHRLNTSLTYPEHLAHWKLPALLLQPVVENAIKYGLYDTTEAITITIEALQQGPDLTIRISNPFDPSTQNKLSGTGFGLNSINRRLYLLYGRHNLVQTAQQNNTFITILKIPPFK
ncbi:MAG TPA: histidine kinase [Phnomibacter sp.]|nr:histidine kinase [Phnomibacter sp.]